ncbi:hypothetical protein GCM10011575_33160 [Microlunatus endophyticus]|uniref:MinD-like ATPase involved in chromosome partitioning or flagellar assembly n=2 Tax=Microlunatus endophyticus TaxID=1716077 RepID=A0A917SEU1_9ACTN|nr:hypothetical protein GCM10011575_33160 [Microlunatus endophyticus]
MIFGSAGSAVDSLRATDAGIRAGLPLSRRIGFVSIAGGAGTTTTVASVAATLAARRSGSILAVDADGGRSGLGRHLIEVRPRRSEQTTPEAGTAAADRRRTARTIEDARSGLPVVGRLPLLDLNDPVGAGAPVAGAPVAGQRSVAEWTGQLGPIARFFDLVLTDWGIRPAAEDLEQVAATGHVLVLVARADQPSAAADTLAGLRELPESPRLVLVLTDIARTAALSRLTADLSDALDLPVFGLPYDPAVGSDWLYATGRRSIRSRQAVARLAAGLVTEAAGLRASARIPAAAVPAAAAPGAVRPA